MSGEEEQVVLGDGWISDDSSFYGGEKQQVRLREFGDDFDLRGHWRLHATSINAIASAARRQSTKHLARPTITNSGGATNLLPGPSLQQSPVQTQPVLCDLYKGRPNFRQLSESVSDFTKRLPPLTTVLGPDEWISIANPYVSEHETYGDLAEFQSMGRELLSQYMTKKQEIESRNPGKAKGTTTHMLGPAREGLKNDIASLAKEKGVMSGKWMFFPSSEDLPRTWRLVAEAVADSRLGHLAKVAPAAYVGDRSTRVICVYTKDFTDVEDVRLVLEGLVDTGLLTQRGFLAGEPSRSIYYKADAYTLLDVNANNEYGIPPTLHSSKDMLSTPKVNNKRPVVEQSPTGKGVTSKKQMTLDAFRSSQKDERASGTIDKRRLAADALARRGL